MRTGRGVAGSVLLAPELPSSQFFLTFALGWAGSIRSISASSRGSFPAGPVDCGLPRRLSELGLLFHLPCFGNTNLTKIPSADSHRRCALAFFKILKVKMHLGLEGLPSVCLNQAHLS